MLSSTSLSQWRLGDFGTILVIFSNLRLRTTSPSNCSSALCSSCFWKMANILWYTRKNVMAFSSSPTTLSNSGLPEGKAKNVVIRCPHRVYNCSLLDCISLTRKAIGLELVSLIEGNDFSLYFSHSCEDHLPSGRCLTNHVLQESSSTTRNVSAY